MTDMSQEKPAGNVYARTVAAQYLLEATSFEQPIPIVIANVLDLRSKITGYRGRSLYPLFIRAIFRRLLAKNAKNHLG